MNARQCRTCAMIRGGEHFENDGDMCVRCRNYNLSSKDLRRKIQQTVNNHNRRARQLNQQADLAVEEWQSILEASEGICQYCYRYTGIALLSLEHKIPLAGGGGTTALNVVPVCLYCNYNKGSDHQYRGNKGKPSRYR